MNEEVKETISTQRIEKGIICLSLGFSLLLLIILALFLLKREINQIHDSVLFIQDGTKQNLNSLELIKTDKQLLAEALQVFKNVPETRSEEIIKKAKKFEIIKGIYSIRQKLKENSNIHIELENIIGYYDYPITNKIKDFISSDFSSLKSNVELISVFEKIHINQLKPKESVKGYSSKLKQYFNKLVSIKTSKDYEQEKLLNDKLIQIKKAVEVGNIFLAYNTLKSIMKPNEELGHLQNLLHTRIKLEKLLNELTLSVIQND